MSKNEITRIDFAIHPQGVVVNKYDRSWEYSPGGLVSHETKTDFDVEAAISWLQKHGWKVRRWPGGARAWLGEIKPIRTRGRIQKIRDELRERPRPELQGAGVALDLAYDL